jgi:hypothetical protein
LYEGKKAAAVLVASDRKLIRPLLKRGIPWKSPPNTFQDATTICRDLGVFYPWIDSLCIIKTAMKIERIKLHVWEISTKCPFHLGSSYGRG